MWKPLHPFYNFWRRYFGNYTLEDPRSIYKSAPYTFYLPSKERQDSVAVGDAVRLIFMGETAGLVYSGERMWVDVVSVEGSNIIGTLANKPFDMPQLKLGDTVKFQPFHIIDFETERKLPQEVSHPQYWDRCMVDQCVLDHEFPVYFIYREEPDLAQSNEKYPDSGWRIRGDYRHMTDEELDERKVQYIALGKVLNADDSWVHLIDSPVGSAFIRNFETGVYEPDD